MINVKTVSRVGLALGLLLACNTATADETEATYRGVSRAVRFDISPPLRSIPAAAFYNEGRLIVDPETTPALAPSPHEPDPVVQTEAASMRIPGPLVSFDGMPNSSGVSPPDTVGDVGPNHYVAMMNLSFAVYNKDGTLEYGPVPNNTLWAGFGGDCQTDNDGDPIVLYDQLADRWLLTQFTASGPTYYNCVALSTSPDPTGTYYRWAFSTGANFPDYPKYGIWSDAYYIATREFGSVDGIGAYAVNREDMLAGEPSPQMISFFKTHSPAYNTGDGLLPADIDGTTLPPAGSPSYWIGSMDNGAQYGAPQDALTLWQFHADFADPPSSSFTLVSTIPTAPFDSQFPCSPGSRDCIPQPGTGNKIDIQSYRQRVLHRLAYRNFGTHESLVTNQSVEAVPNIGGIRWYEIRDPGGTPVIYQQGTYAPGATDGIHRWMGSIAMDSAGNIALGYSASNSSTYPSVWYAGRLASDPLGTLPQGEGSIIDGTGSQTGSQRWGDYSSMNVDPTDDCTFWYVNEYLPTSSGTGWRLRIGAFRFNECGTPDFVLGVSPNETLICAGSEATTTVDVGVIADFSEDVTLEMTQGPLGTTGDFSINPVTPPGSSTLTIQGTGSLATGTYAIEISGSALSSPGHSAQFDLNVIGGAPEGPTLLSPVDGAWDQPLDPTFSWEVSAETDSYTIEIATDSAFSNIIDSATLEGTEYPIGVSLIPNTRYFWRVRGTNLCGPGTNSAVFSLVTFAPPGVCPQGSVSRSVYGNDFETEANGWTHSGTADSWALSTDRAHSGVTSWKAEDPDFMSDQRLVSPPMIIPVSADITFLRYWNYQEIQSGADSCYDGALLEISTDGSTWTRINVGDLLTDPITRSIESSTGNPLGGLKGWCGDPAPWTESIVDLAAYAGETVQMRYRLGTDNAVAREGWYIDDVVLETCSFDSDLFFADGFESGDTSAWSGTVQ